MPIESLTKSVDFTKSVYLISLVNMLYICLSNPCLNPSTLIESCHKKCILLNKFWLDKQYYCPKYFQLGFR